MSEMFQSKSDIVTLNDKDVKLEGDLVDKESTISQNTKQMHESDSVLDNETIDENCIADENNSKKMEFNGDNEKGGDHNMILTPDSQQLATTDATKVSPQTINNISSEIPVDLDEDPPGNNTLQKESQPVSDQITQEDILEKDDVSTFMDVQQTWRDRNQSSSSGCSVDAECPLIIEQMNTSIQQTVQTPKHIKTRGELSIDDLPPVEYLSVSAEDRVELQLLGDVSSVIDKIVVIEAITNSPPLDMDSVLFFKDRRVFGQVFETFGRVKSPHYIVRFNCKEDVKTHGIVPGISVYYAANETAYSRFVLPKDIQLASKGSDASWKDNNEPPISLLEFSDDEEERAFKRSLKKKDGVTAGETDENVVTIPDDENAPSNSRDRKRSRPNKMHRQKMNVSSGGNNSSVNSAPYNTYDANGNRSNQQTGNWFSNPNSQHHLGQQSTRPPFYMSRPPSGAFNSSGNHRPSFMMQQSYSPVAFPDLSRPPPPHNVYPGVNVNANSPAYSNTNHNSPYLGSAPAPQPLRQPFTPPTQWAPQTFINNPPPLRPNWSGNFPLS